MKKEFNIIEAVKYLEKNPNAIIESGMEEKVFLILEDYFSPNQKVMIKKQDGSLDPLWVVDFTHNWILEEPEEKLRTHKEIMTNWFEIGAGWYKVIAYDKLSRRYKISMHENKYVDKEFFNNLEMKTNEEILEMDD